MSSIIKTGIVDLSWSQVVGVDGYNLEVIGDDLFYRNESVTGSSTTSFRLSGVDDGVAYYAKVYYYSGYNTSVNYQTNLIYCQLIYLTYRSLMLTSQASAI